jgi:hypothetical protein
MQQPGEQVVLIPKEAENQTGQVGGASDEQKKPNWQLWGDYFFGD